MLVRLLLLVMLIVLFFFGWLSLVNPVDVEEFHFFGKTFETDLPILMISSFVLGAMLVFLGTLARDPKRAIEGYQKSREKRREESLKEEMNKGMDLFLQGNLSKAKTHFTEVLKRDPTQIDIYLRLSEIVLREGNDQEALHWLGRAELLDMKNVLVPIVVPVRIVVGVGRDEIRPARTKPVQGTAGHEIRVADHGKVIIAGRDLERRSVLRSIIRMARPADHQPGERPC